MKRLLFITVLLFFFVQMIKDDPLKLTNGSCQDKCQSIASAEVINEKAFAIVQNPADICPFLISKDTLEIVVEEKPDNEFSESMTQSNKTNDYTASALITRKEMAGFFIQPKSDLTP